jgi:hypothetical protein
LNEPSILKPYDGFFTDQNQIEFMTADIGYYLSLDLGYFVEISDNIGFVDPVAVSGNIVPQDGIVTWRSPQLPEGLYFWRTRLYDGSKYSDWTDPRNFTITNTAGNGYIAIENQLKLFENYNFNYSVTEKSLVLNTDILPPRPSTDKVIDTMGVVLPNPNFQLTAITTDGSYIYYANKSFYNQRQPSEIYKIGTGFNGTRQGQSYPSVPNFSAEVWNCIFYHDGFIYIATGDPYRLVKVDPETGDSTLQFIPNGMLDNSLGTISDGSQYLTSDGQYVYNIAFTDSTGNNKFIVRTFDPSNGWNMVGGDLETASTSWGPNFSGFFIADGYFFPYENFNGGYMKRIRLNDGFFEEEWLTNSIEEGFQGYHGWCYDRENDIVYASIARSGFPTQIRSFIGKYKETRGSLTSPIVGPSSKWNSVTFELDETGYQGTSTNYLFGLNRNTGIWDTLKTNVAAAYDISDVNTREYKYLRMHFDFEDSSSGVSNPVSFRLFRVDYESLPEIILRNEDFSFTPDSLLQGFDVEMKFEAFNIGYTTADSLEFNFFMNNADSAFFSQTVSIPADSSAQFTRTMNTSTLLFFNNIQVESTLHEDEFYTFNNLARDSFFVSRDSLRPKFSITFDGLEILNGDIISSKPNIQIRMSDNSPLPIDTSYFFVYLNNESQSFLEDTMNYSYSPYPNSEAVIDWQPSLTDGRHILEVLAKDASGNFFDTTSFRISFLVKQDNDVFDIYNYPNPFSDETYFTFNVSGSQFPEEMNIKIYTIAGRLIREIDIPVSSLQYGFNRFYWDGRDQDGNLIANGVYFYKFTILNNGEYTSEIKKIAKVK